VSDNKKFIAQTVKMLETILQRVDNLQEIFNKLEKRINTLENAESFAVSKTFKPKSTPRWQDSMDEKLSYLTDKLKMIPKEPKK